MRATAYQATVKDLIAAGLNPILAAQLGATSAGTGATASAATAAGAMGRGHATMMQQQDVPNIVRTVGYGVASSKKAAEALNSELKKIANKAKELYEKELDEGYAFLGILGIGIVGMGIICVCANIKDIITALTLPEKTIIEFIMQYK